MRFSSKELAIKTFLALSISFYSSNSMVYALPSQGVLDNTAAATITTNGNVMSVEGKGLNNIINWATFSIANGETVKFGKSNYLNLVHGADISRIYGTISGGNYVYLVNPNGVIFGQGAKLDNIGNLIVSTRNISSINKEAFLADGGNESNILGLDNTVKDNKVLYTDKTKYASKITVADLKLTNVPNSATRIILDGPEGVILKNTETLDKVTEVITRKDTGEIGIGSETGSVELSNIQKEKIKVIKDNIKYNFNNDDNIIKGYKAVKTISDILDTDAGTLDSPSQRHMLWNNIEAAGVGYYYPITYNGIFEGLGYQIAGLTINSYIRRGSEGNRTGVFGEFSGELRNLSLEAINFSSLGKVHHVGAAIGYLKNGLVSNVHTSGEIKGAIAFATSTTIGGIVGTMDLLGSRSEIRNSGSHVIIDVSGGSGLSSYPFAIGGVLGKSNGTYFGGLYNVYSAESISATNDQNRVDMGGIVGHIYTYRDSNPGFEVIGAYSVSDLSSTHGDPIWRDQPISLGGIIGAVEHNKVKLGDLYYLGKINKKCTYKESYIDLHTGGIIGRNYRENNITNAQYDGNNINSYHVYNDGNATYNTVFGDEKSKLEMGNLFDKNMISIYDVAKIGGGVSSGYFVPDPIPLPNPGEDNPAELSKEEHLKQAVEQLKYYEKVTEVQSSYKDKVAEFNEETDRVEPISPSYSNIINNYEKPVTPQDYEEALGDAMKDIDQLLAYGKSIMELCENSTDNDAFAVSKAYIGFVKSLNQLIHDRKNGIRTTVNVTELAESGIKLQKELLLLNKKLDNKTKFKFFNDEKNIKSLGVVSGFLGMASSYIAASSDLDSKRVGEAAADYIDCLESVVDLAENVYKYKHAGEDVHAGVSLLKTGSIWNPLDIYCAIGIIGVKSGAQLVRSISEHAADGKWDMKDTSETGLEVSLTGMKAFTHCLTFGVDDLIFGAIDKTNGKVPIVEQAIMGYKIGAANLGKFLYNAFHKN